MTNLPITGNNSPAVPANAVAGAAQKNDTSDTQSTNPFGAVLARQIQADDANATTSSMPLLASGIDTKTTDDPAAVAGQSEQDKTLLASMPNDPSSALAAMLQLPQEIRLPLAKDATTATAAAVRGAAGKATMVGGMAGMAMLRETSANKADITQPPVNAAAMPTKAKLGFAVAAPGKADAATMVTDNVARADKLALRNAPPGLEIVKPVELPGKLADAAQSAQWAGQAASLIATTSNISANDKAANGSQTISSPLGSSGWADEFSQKITWMGTQQNQVAELHLNPPDLGPLDVVLKVSDNQATALFTSPHSAVRDAVENALPRLREILADNGIALGNVMVSDQSPRDRSADGAMNNGNGAAAQREAADEIHMVTGGEASATAQAVQARRHNGMVDTFA